MKKVLDLFSGIGGFSLGLEATEGFSTQAFVENNLFCQKVLHKHWPEVPIYGDIKEVATILNQFDVMCGGFPCQDVSVASSYNQNSILGTRSGLWNEYFRLICEGKPTWVIIENVENLRNKGLGIILSQLASIGYDAEWHIIRACDVGLPHVRKRLWIIAYLVRDGVEGNSPFPLQGLREISWRENGRRAETWVQRSSFTDRGLLRSSHGIPNYMDRVNALGNSIVPDIAYNIGKAILETGL